MRYSQALKLSLRAIERGAAELLGVELRTRTRAGCCRAPAARPRRRRDSLRAGLPPPPARARCGERALCPVAHQIFFPPSFLHRHGSAHGKHAHGRTGRAHIDGPSVERRRRDGHPFIDLAGPPRRPPRCGARSLARASRRCSTDQPPARRTLIAKQCVFVPREFFFLKNAPPGCPSARVRPPFPPRPGEPLAFRRGSGARGARGGRRRIAREDSTGGSRLGRPPGRARATRQSRARSVIRGPDMGGAELRRAVFLRERERGRGRGGPTRAEESRCPASSAAAWRHRHTGARRPAAAAPAAPRPWRPARARESGGDAAAWRRRGPVAEPEDTPARARHLHRRGHLHALSMERVHRRRTSTCQRLAARDQLRGPLCGHVHDGQHARARAFLTLPTDSDGESCGPHPNHPAPQISAVTQHSAPHSRPFARTLLQLPRTARALAQSQSPRPAN